MLLLEGCENRGQSAFDIANVCFRLLVWTVLLKYYRDEYIPGVEFMVRGSAILLYLAPLYILIAFMGFVGHYSKPF